MLELLAIMALGGGAVFFRRPITAVLCQARILSEKNLPVGAKIAYTLKQIESKRKKAKKTFHEINKFIDIIVTQTDKEYQASSFEVKTLEEITERGSYIDPATETRKFTEAVLCNCGDILTDVKGVCFNDDGDLEAIKISSTRFLDRRVTEFEITKKDKHFNRLLQLRKTWGRLRQKNKKIESLIKRLDATKTDLEHDKQYLEVAQNLKGIQSFTDDNLLVDIDSVSAEIYAIEQDIELEEKLQLN